MRTQRYERAHERAVVERVPDLDGAVPRARHDALPVEGHGCDGILVAGERL